jgi:hypothetical protein
MIKITQNFINYIFSYQKNYWLTGSKPLSLSISRICIYFALFYNVSGSLGFFPSFEVIDKRLAVYEPSIWQRTGLGLIFSTQPSSFVIWMILIIAEATTLTSVLGFFTRSSMIIATLTSLTIGGITYGWDAFAGHRYNIIYLAALAFMFANAGKYFSIDTYLKKQFGFGRANQSEYNEWPILLAQASISLMLFAAFYAKLGFLRLEPTLSWIFSDNIRNMIAYPYSVRGYNMEAWLRFTISHPITWMVSAAIQLFMQGSPILTLLTKNPTVRLFEAIIFIIGLILLYIVMTIGNWHWGLLVVLFIDWEYWLTKVNLMSFNNIEFVNRKVKVASKIYILCFILFYIAISFTPYKYGASFNKKFYPFFPMDFYSGVWHLPPISVFEHKQWNYLTDDHYVITDDGKKLDYQGWFHGSYNYALNQNNSDGIQAREAHLRQLFSRIRRQTFYPYSKINKPWSPWQNFEGVEPYPNKGLKTLEAYVSIYSIPAYPNNLLDRKRIVRGLMGIYDAEKDIVKTAHAHYTYDNGYILSVDVRGFEKYQVELLYAADPFTAVDAISLKPLPFIYVNSHSFRIIKMDTESWIAFVKVVDQESKEEYIFCGPILYCISPPNNQGS